MNLDELQAQLTAAQSEVTQLKADKAALETRSTTAEAKLATATAKVTDLEGQVATLTTKTNDLTAQLTAANTNLSATQTAFDAYKSGESARIDQAVQAKLPAAVDEKLKVELPKAAAAAGFRIPSPPTERKDDPNDKRSPREKLEAAVAEQLKGL